jgi:uncharacterized membrane protein
VWVWLLLWLHLMGAILWVGGQLFLLAVVLPVARQELGEAQRTRLAGRIGRRFAALSGGALALLVVTGALLALLHGVTEALLLATTWGRVLLAKAALVGVVLALTLVHGAYYGRRLERLAARSEDAAAEGDCRHALQRQSARLSAANLALNLLVVALGAWLATLS